MSAISFENLKSFFEIGGLLSLFLTAAFAVGAWYTTNQINQRQANELRAFQLQVYSEQQKTTDAQQKLVESEQNLIGAQKELAQA